jgi:magnesium-transporting ATPase (P-type)
MNLEFLGLIVMENRLKPETRDVIDRLKDANIRTIMCTGDNILTGLSVARECHMISQNDRVILVEAASPGVTPKFSCVKEANLNSSESFENINHFHFAIDGKSFGVIRNEQKELLEKVLKSLISPTNFSTKYFI